MPDSIVKQRCARSSRCRADELIGGGGPAGGRRRPARRCRPSRTTGSFAGIFGEREFMAALFPGYVGELASARDGPRSIDEAIERRESCRDEPIREYLTTDHVVVEDEYSDTQLAELFLHHRVLIIPIATEGRIHAVVTRSDFFAELVSEVRGGWAEPADLVVEAEDRQVHRDHDETDHAADHADHDGLDQRGHAP